VLGQSARGATREQVGADGVSKDSKGQEGR